VADKDLKPSVGPTMNFGLEDMCPLPTPDNDALMIKLKIATTMVHRILIDTRISSDIITNGGPSQQF